LFNDLVTRLGQSAVFMDVDSISLGRDFRTELQGTLASCDVMLVLIDKDWAAAKDERGRIRLENTGDFVRMEVEAGLKRDIVVTPVLLKGARMPAVEELPAAISALAYRNAFEISHSRWESDVREMIRRLHLGVPEEDGQVDTKLHKPLGIRAPVPLPKAPTQTGATRRRSLIGAGAVAITGVLGGGAYMLLNWKENLVLGGIMQLHKPNEQPTAVTPAVPAASPQVSAPIGASAISVQDVKRILMHLNLYSGEVDDVPDASYRKALVDFQASRAVDADGNMGPLTASLLRQAWPEYFQIGGPPISVQDVKRTLTHIKLYSGEIDDVPDASYRKALREFQASRGTLADGEVGPATASHLRQAWPEYFGSRLAPTSGVR
jgi:peptidoglycan hydrolase-like protein with peptidoglycan-binding domain